MKLLPRVIIMDDDRGLRERFKSTLSKSNLDVGIAKSVEQLIEIVQDDHVDAGIIDIRMSRGGEEGLEAIRRLKELKPDIYIEVQTGYKQYVARAFAMGADEVFVKPAGYGTDAGTRIHKRILQKRIQSLSNAAGADLQHLVEELGTKGPDQTAQAAYQASVLKDIIGNLKSFLEAEGTQYAIPKSSITDLQRDLIDYVILGLMSPEGQTHHHGGIAQDLLDNINYRAYLREEISLRKSHLGQYVAFVNGELVASAPDIKSIHQALDNKFLDADAFIRKISDEDRLAVLDIPRRVIKKGP